MAFGFASGFDKKMSEPWDFIDRIIIATLDVFYFGRIWSGDEREKSTRGGRNATLSRQSVHMASRISKRWERAGK